MPPETKYAKAPDGVHIAYQLAGGGPIDIVFVMGWTTNIEGMWREPALAAFLTRLSSMGRLILFDRRGLGLSDRIADDVLPTLETRMDDVRVVMDAVGSERAAVIGVSEGGPLSVLFAATHPGRTSSLVLFGTMARFGWAEDFPWGQTDASLREELDRIDRLWGTEELAARELREWAAPSAAGDARLISWLAEYTRSAASPGAAITLTRMNHDIDVRDALGAVHVPTLVLGRTEDHDFDIAATRQLAAGIRGAELVEFPGSDHFFWMGDAESLLVAIESLTFNELKKLLDTTDGNLSVHARKLEEAGYVGCAKSFEGRMPRTDYRLTTGGRKALERYLDHMEALIHAMRER